VRHVFARNRFAYLPPYPSSRSLECCRLHSSDGIRRTLAFDVSNLSDRNQPVAADEYKPKCWNFFELHCHKAVIDAQGLVAHSCQNPENLTGWKCIVANRHLTIRLLENCVQDIGCTHPSNGQSVLNHRSEVLDVRHINQRLWIELLLRHDGARLLSSNNGIKSSRRHQPVSIAIARQWPERFRSCS
jgi:hypothetical protein